MTSKIAFLVVFAITVSLVGSAYAHKSEVVGDYKIEVGWKNEPPVAGMDNEITLTVTKATAFDKAEAEKEDQETEGMNMTDSHDTMDHESMNDTMDHESMDEHDHEDETMEHHMGEAATSGTLKGFTADVMLGDNDYPLNLVEDAKYPDVYHAKFMPSETGYPMVHISGKLAGEDTDITFHPEQVEELNTLSPMQQTENGINPEDVQCKEGLELYKRTTNQHAVCLKPSSAEKMSILGLVEHF